MQWTPYEVKRLEYQLRIDAASHCPGTEVPLDETTELEPNGESVDSGRVTLLQRLTSGLFALLRSRQSADAT